MLARFDKLETENKSNRQNINSLKSTVDELRGENRELRNRLDAVETYSSGDNFKICGLKELNYSEAATAVDLGATSIGAARSPRMTRSYTAAATGPSETNNSTE